MSCYFQAGNRKIECCSSKIRVLNVFEDHFKKKKIKSGFTYSPAPMAKLSGLPLMKYKFSPLQWNTLKCGLNL